MTAPTEDLIARLRRKRRYGPECGLMPEQLPRPTLVNPDGPAAAQALRALRQEVERLREAWSLCVEMVAAEDSLIAELIDDERYLDALKMDFPITNRMRAMIASSALTGSAQG